MPLTQSPQMTMPLAEQYLVGDEPASASILSREKCFKKRESSAIKKLTRKLHEMRQKCKMQSKKIRFAKKLTLSKSFLTTIEKLPDAAQIFIKLQLKGTKKPRGRRYTRNEKIMALSIYKQSPKAYNLLKKMFILPSKRCLQKILSSFQMKPGINAEILENLKKQVQHMTAEKRLVNLLFDEVSLAPGMVYNDFLNEIIGFPDDGSKKAKDIADRALVFMIKGIKSKTKQPILFIFTKSGIKKQELKDLLIETIKSVNSTGLKVVSAICDQCPTNVAVIRELREETQKKYAVEGKPTQTTFFEVDNTKVFPLFDTPHLLKGVRNNLLNKDAKFMLNGQERWAKWEHLKMLLAIDVGDDEIRLVNKLTESLINKEKLKKMKVKLAAQVFSQRVSSALRFSGKHGILPAECEGTADFLLIFDKLFDSFNGHSYQDDSKMYKSCVKKNSPHFQLWDDLLPTLESIRFKSISKKNGIDQIKYEMIPSIKNWILNIKTFKEMWEYLSSNYKITNLITRNFNQDPLENFFSSIRSNGVRNINPNCYQFINAYKTLIVNNYNSPHSAGANCEEDYNSVMQSLSCLIGSNRADSNTVDFACNIDSLLSVMTEIKNNDSLLHAESKKYVTGYVIKKSKTKVFKSCTNCVNNLCRSSADLESFNYEIDYTKRSLFHPSDKFIDLMNNMYYVIVACLRNNPTSKCLKDEIKFYIDCACDFNIITCRKHKGDLIDFIINLSIKLIVHSWCLGVNRLLNGKTRCFDRNDQIKEKVT
ncbi:uncharacterized protein LOC113505320 isoform X2 [Trichoplusia ni]|uniref:Uncharacterized protein LOC113505320 isoform X2 n=1 Tax=Trichoplusia ni TaxID=7111 RepID=A0A7E5WT47_TRINI|nr:uncharacterized protein LOC113505320 isoform X2 [Trichoplusia ni]